MTTHTIAVIRDDNTQHHRAACSCGWQSCSFNPVVGGNTHLVEYATMIAGNFHARAVHLHGGHASACLPCAASSHPLAGHHGRPVPPRRPAGQRYGRPSPGL